MKQATSKPFAAKINSSSYQRVKSFAPPFSPPQNFSFLIFEQIPIIAFGHIQIKKAQGRQSYIGVFILSCKQSGGEVFNISTHSPEILELCKTKSERNKCLPTLLGTKHL